MNHPGIGLSGQENVVFDSGGNFVLRQYTDALCQDACPYERTPERERRGYSSKDPWVYADSVA